MQNESASASESESVRVRVCPSPSLSESVSKSESHNERKASKHETGHETTEMSDSEVQENERRTWNSERDNVQATPPTRQTRFVGAINSLPQPNQRQSVGTIGLQAPSSSFGFWHVEVLWERIAATRTQKQRRSGTRSRTDVRRCRVRRVHDSLPRAALRRPSGIPHGHTDPRSKVVGLRRALYVEIGRAHV